MIIFNTITFDEETAFDTEKQEKTKVNIYLSHARHNGIIPSRFQAIKLIMTFESRNYLKVSRQCCS